MANGIDQYSVASVPLNLKANGNSIGTATGFFWKNEEEQFLISNWHVFSGRSPITGQPIHSSGAVPDEIQVYVPRRNALGNWNLVQVSLLDSNGGSLWIQHPQGQDVDVAALEISPSDDDEPYPLPMADDREDMRVVVSMDIFIVGFPLGIARQRALPIWKRGSIASEPEIPLEENLPAFLIDSATREGMSGSPVYCRTFGSYTNNSGGVIMTGGSPTKFLGIYSGRFIPDNEFEAHIGRVWNKLVLEEIIQNRTPGTFEIR